MTELSKEMGKKLEGKKINDESVKMELLKMAEQIKEALQLYEYKKLLRPKRP